MFFKIHIVYIDEAESIFNVSAEEALRRRNFIIDHCTKYKFNYTILNLESIYDVKQRLVMDVANDLEDKKYQQIH